MNDIYRQMMARLHQELAQDGLPNDRAAQISAQTVQVISSEFGGQNVYLPRRSPWFSFKRRDEAIRKEFNGRNMPDVCRRFNVSARTVYRACNRK